MLGGDGKAAATSLTLRVGWPHAAHPQHTILAGKPRRQLGNTVIQHSPTAALVSHQGQMQKNNFPSSRVGPHHPTCAAAAECKHNVKTPVFPRDGQAKRRFMVLPALIMNQGNRVTTCPPQQVFKMGIKSVPFRLITSLHSFQHLLFPSFIIFLWRVKRMSVIVVIWG